MLRCDPNGPLCEFKNPSCRNVLSALYCRQLLHESRHARLFGARPKSWGFFHFFPTCPSENLAHCCSESTIWEFQLITNSDEFPQTPGPRRKTARDIFT